MDASDAFNVMTYASDTPGGEPGYALWDIFRADDSSKLREFLRERHNITDNSEDPIHAQKYYLDAAQRLQLWETRRVAAHRIVQRPGDGVFIPAGCAHQARISFSPPFSLHCLRRFGGIKELVPSCEHVPGNRPKLRCLRSPSDIERWSAAPALSARSQVHISFPGSG
jgi:hypothetical protein